MNKFFITLFLFLTTLSVKSQSTLNTDSLQQIIKDAKHDTDIVNAYYSWGDYYWYSNPDSTQKYLKICVDLLLLNVNNEENSSAFYSLIT